MTTKRETILAAIRTALSSPYVEPEYWTIGYTEAAIATQVGSRIYRSRVEPMARQESPAIVIEPINDTAQQNTSLPTLDWSLTVRVAVIVRGNVPDQQADPIVEDLHSRLMADLTLGGYAIDIQPQSVSFDMVDADQPAGVISCDYLVRYRTSVTNLATL